jgi:hypothetical protein
MSSKKVTFCQEEPLEVHLDPLDRQDDLKKYRTSDTFRRLVDRIRMEKTLSPILCQEHRNRVLKRLFPLSPLVNSSPSPPPPPPSPPPPYPPPPSPLPEKIPHDD